jgi:endosialidase-like protein
MPADDLVLNIKQIAGYPPITNAPTSGLLLMQLGIGGPYQSISPQDLVGTALATGGGMSIAGPLSVQAMSGGSAQFTNAAISMFSAQKACIVDLAATWGTLAGVQIATVDDVANLNAAIRAASVWSFNGRVGDVRLWIDDIICAGGAPIFSPRFQGSPRACTPDPSSNSSRLATTAFVTNAVGTAFASYAPLDSPDFSGLPTAPTAALGTSTGQLATTAFVMTAVADSTTGVVSFNGRSGLVVLLAADVSALGFALLASPTFTGTPQAPTAGPGTNTAQLATCAFVQAAVAAATAGVASFNGRTGVVTLTSADVAAVGVSSFNGRIGAVSLIANDISAAGGAVLASPIFTGLPQAPTAALGTSTAQLATCAFVAAAIAALPAQPAPSTANPLMDGTAAPGTSVLYSRGDHVHPTDTSRAAASALANYMPLIGGNFTGSVSAPAMTITGTLGANEVAATDAVSAGGTITATVGFNCQSANGQTTLGFTGPGVATWQNVGIPSNVQLDIGGNFVFNGPGQAVKAGGGPWVAPSDARIKTELGDYELGLAEVLALRPIVFEYKGNDGDPADPLTKPLAKAHRQFIGFIAQELEQIFPAMVTSHPGYIDGRAVTDFRYADIGELTYALVNAVKTLAARIAALER